jgi:hypothetical protein
MKYCCSESFLTQQALHLYNIYCIVVPQGQSTRWWHHFKVKGHIMVKVGCQRNPYFLSSCYQINSKLGLKVEYGLPLSWLIFGDQPWPSWVSLRVNICLLQGQILESKIPYRVVPHIKALDECFPNQIKFWRYDVIRCRHNVKTEFSSKI